MTQGVDALEKRPRDHGGECRENEKENRKDGGRPFFGTSMFVDGLNRGRFFFCCIHEITSRTELPRHYGASLPMFFLYHGEVTSLCQRGMDSLRVLVKRGGLSPPFTRVGRHFGGRSPPYKALCFMTRKV